MLQVTQRTSEAQQRSSATGLAAAARAACQAADISGRILNFLHMSKRRELSKHFVGQRSKTIFALVDSHKGNFSFSLHGVSREHFPRDTIGVQVGHLSHLGPAPIVSSSSSRALHSDGQPGDFPVDGPIKCAICFAMEPEEPDVEGSDDAEFDFSSVVCMAVFEDFPFPDWKYLPRNRRIFDYGRPRLHALECCLPLCHACIEVSVPDDEVYDLLAQL